MLGHLVVGRYSWEPRTPQSDAKGFFTRMFRALFHRK